MVINHFQVLDSPWMIVRKPTPKIKHNPKSWSLWVAAQITPLISGENNPRETHVFLLAIERFYNMIVGAHLVPTLKISYGT